MIVHLLDGTYALFRHFYGLRRFTTGTDRPYGAVAGVLHTVLQLIEAGATHIGVATDHVIESFRNDLWAGYKTGEGVDPTLKAQFEPLEEALVALGVTVWPLVEFEADDGLAAAAAVAEVDDRVDKVVIWTVDKDLGQCVRGKVVQHDRKSGRMFDADAVLEKFGVRPESIADYLALVGDSADGFPGLPGWGAKSAGAVLRRYGTIEAIPDNAAEWNIDGLRGAPKLAATLAAARDVAAHFKVLATLRTDVPVGTVDDWEWRGPTPELKGWAERLEAPHI